MLYRYYLYDPDEIDNPESFLRTSTANGRGIGEYTRLKRDNCFYKHQCTNSAETSTEPLYDPSSGLIPDYDEPNEREAALLMWNSLIDGMESSPSPEQLFLLWNNLVGEGEIDTNNGMDRAGWSYQLGHRLLWDWEVHREYCRKWINQLLSCIRGWIHQTEPIADYCKLGNVYSSKNPLDSQVIPDYSHFTIPLLK